jgi:hypothetical protein
LAGEKAAVVRKLRENCFLKIVGCWSKFGQKLSSTSFRGAGYGKLETTFDFALKLEVYDKERNF